MPTARWLALLEETAAAGSPRVQLTGGEPCIHPDAFEIISHARGLGLSVELFTNATLLENRDIDLMADLGVDVATSLHSHLPKTHDSMTGKTGSHEKTLRAIEKLVEREVEVRVATVLTHLNGGHGERTAQLLGDIGVLAPHKADPVRPTGRGSIESPPSDEPSSYCGGLPETASSILHTADGPRPTCWDGKLAISPDGCATPCIFARGLEVGSVRDRPLASLLESPRLRALWGMTLDEVEECRHCEHKKTCFDCRALPLSVYGDLFAKNPRCQHQPKRRKAPETSAERYSLEPDVASLELDGERLLLEPRHARLHRLNSVAAMILAKLETGSPRSLVAEELSCRFGISRGEAEQDVEDLVRTMLLEGLLSGVDEPGSNGSTRGERGPGGEQSNPGRPQDGPLPTEPRTFGGPKEHRGNPRRSSPLRGRRAGPGETRFHDSLHRLLVDCAGEAAVIEAPLDLTARLEELLSEVIVHGGSHTGQEGRVPEHVVTVLIRGPRRRPLFHLFGDGVRLIATRSIDTLLSTVETQLCTIATEQRPAPGEASSLCLHAGSLAGEAGAAVLPGAHGAGKSTLTAWGVSAGLAYLGDEVALLERDDMGTMLEGFPKPIKLKEPGFELLPRSLADAFLAPERTGRGEHGWLKVRGERGPKRAAGIVCIHRRGGPARLEPIRAGDVVELLLTQSFNIKALGTDRALAEAARLAEELPTYSLDTSDLPSAALVLAKWLGAKSR